MKKIKSPQWLLAILLTLFASSCVSSQNGDTGNFKDIDPTKRNGEPTAAQKHAAASLRDAREPDHPAMGKSSPPAIQKTALTSVGGVDVYKTLPFPAVIYQGGLAVDVDGSPNAYHPKPDDDKGLDYLADAGSPGNWWGVATDSSGTPFIQKSSDPAPGYYVSTTSLEDPNYPISDPRMYVNASEIPFIVLPANQSYFGGHMGDIGAVVNFKTGKVTYVIAADVGPSNKLGEGSAALAEALGVNSSAKDGGTGSGIGYCFFPGSGTNRPQSRSAINQTGAELFSKFGGISTLKSLLNAQ